MKKLTLLPICLFFISFSAFAQDYDKDIKQADKEFKKALYDKAIELYKSSYTDLGTTDPIAAKEKKAHILFQIAECYRMLDVPRQEVIWYNKAIKAGEPDTSASRHIAEANQEISTTTSQVLPTSSTAINTNPIATNGAATVTPASDGVAKPPQKSGVRMVPHDADTTKKQ